MNQRATRHNLNQRAIKHNLNQRAIWQNLNQRANLGATCFKGPLGTT